MKIEKPACREYPDPLSVENSKCLKGIFAIIIVISHIRSTTTVLNNSPIGMILTAAGYLSVAMYFFMSGYGLSISKWKKGDAYIREFPLKRILNFYIKYLLFSLVYFIVALILNPSVLSFLSLKYLVFLDVIIQNGWYLSAVMIVYLLFYLVERIINKGIIIDSLIIYSMYVLIVFLLFNKEIKLFCQSSISLLLGMCFPRFEEWFYRTIGNKKYLLLYLSVFVGFCITLLLGNLSLLPEIPRFIVKALSAPLFVLLILLTAQFIPVQNCVTRFLGKYSTYFTGFLL